MVKQYRINSVVEAEQITAENFDELSCKYPIYVGYTQPESYGHWLVKTQFDRYLVIPNHIFLALYTEVHE